MSRFLFPLAEVPSPQGGVNVILDMIDILVEAGHSAHVVYQSASYAYSYHEISTPSFWDKRLAGAWARGGWRQKIKARLPSRRSASVNEPLKLRKSDIIVIPEIRFPEIAVLYPDNRKICLVQGYMPFANAVRRLGDADNIFTSDTKYIATSEKCVQAVRTLMSREPEEIVLKVSGPKAGADRIKKPKIAYMPRKLKEHVQVVVPSLKHLPEAAHFDFVSLSGLTHKEVIQEFSESLLFLSFSNEEGFGLPPAEAMACECIVIGYTGVGGGEFFTSDVGFPIPSGDLMQFVETTKNVLREYASDPTRLDAMRRHASDSILTRYTAERFRQTTLNAFGKVDK